MSSGPAAAPIGCTPFHRIGDSDFQYYFASASNQGASATQDGIRRHMRIYVNGEEVNAIGVPLRSSDEVVIVQALSGG